MFRSILAGALLAVVSDPAGAATPVATSAAAVVHARLAIGGNAVVIPAELLASGSAPPAYSAQRSVKSFSRKVALPDGTTFSVSSGAAVDLAASHGLVGSTVTATASSTIASVAASVSNPLISGAVGISAASIGSAAAFTAKTGSAPVASGTSVLSGLKVDLSLFGMGVQTYSGTPKANFVLFRSKDGSVEIYLNRQFVMVAAPKGGGKPVATSITVDAVDVHLTDAKVDGLGVSGDLVIGSSYAE
jgi:hypothetical protein